jgi:hypothetical protein
MQKKKIQDYYVKLLLPLLCNFLIAVVNIEIQNVDTLAGTLDIHISNVSHCEYWVGTEQIFDESISELECADMEWSSWYNGLIGGFQFELFGITLIEASGGLADEYLDIVTMNSGTGMILGYSMSNTSIPEGDGILTQVTFSDHTDNIICFGDNEINNVISDANGNMVETEWGYCYDDNIWGCMDEVACNYNLEATADDGSCEYPEEFYNCEGECINDADADGICDELEPPEIAVMPDSLFSNLLSGETDTQIITISNDGEGVLEWTLDFSNGYNATSGIQDNSDSNNFDFSPIINSSRSYYEIGDQISIYHQNTSYEVCYGDYPSESLSLSDFNGETNGGNYNVTFMIMSATW